MKAIKLTLGTDTIEAANTFAQIERMEKMDEIIDLKQFESNLFTLKKCIYDSIKKGG